VSEPPVEGRPLPHELQGDLSVPHPLGTAAGWVYDYRDQTHDRATTRDPDPATAPATDKHHTGRGHQHALAGLRAWQVTSVRECPPEPSLDQLLDERGRHGAVNVEAQCARRERVAHELVRKLGED
jgi:hypothetical protein